MVLMLQQSQTAAAVGTGRKVHYKTIPLKMEQFGYSIIENKIAESVDSLGKDSQMMLISIDAIHYISR